MKKVLVVCSGNTFRSPVLATILAMRIQALGLKISVESAGQSGQFEGEGVHSVTLKCMEKYGIDLRAHRARAIDTLDLTSFAAIVVVDSRMIRQFRHLVPDTKVIVANEAEGGIEVMSPYTRGQEAYDELVEAINRAMPHILEELGKL
jgi:protein-tyrosine-phosphatase